MLVVPTLEGANRDAQYLCGGVATNKVAALCFFLELPQAGFGKSHFN